MNKVITINLNGKAYQLEETGYQALQDYLHDAEAKLKGDPDRTEIMNDLEQALAEKLERFLGPHKTVVTEKEALEVIKEMGPVQAEGKETPDDKTQAPQTPNTKRLYRIREGAMLFGVCTGLAAYFDVDVTVIRIIFVILALLTHGLMFLVYLVMILVVPHANTSAQKAAAFGAPFTAQELIDRARGEYQKFKDSGQWQKWKHEMKEKARAEKREWRQRQRAQRQMRYQSTPFSPLVGLLTALVSLAWILGLISIISKGAVLGFAIPAGVPLWVAILVWICLYGFIMSPLKAARFSYHYSDGQGSAHYHQQGSFAEAIAWMAFIVVIFWLVWQYAPHSHIYFQNVGMWLKNLAVHLKLVKKT